MFPKISVEDAFAKMVSGILENAVRVIIGIKALAQYGKMKLSNNLTLAEVTKSATAKRKGISNEPTIEHMENLKAVAQNIFQPVRDHFAKPIAVTSGYRSPELNRAIGGSSSSQHCKGEAIDIDCDVFGGLSNREVFEFIKDHLVFDQLIYEFGDDKNPDWVHCSYKKENNRGQVLRAVRTNGKTRYEIYRDI